MDECIDKEVLKNRLTKRLHWLEKDIYDSYALA